MASTLPNDFEVAVKIYNYGIKEEPVWFTKLVQDFDREDGMSRMTVSRNIDKLFDLGIISGDWEKVDGKWVRTFKISGEATQLIKKIAEKQE